MLPRIPRACLRMRTWALQHLRSSKWHGPRSSLVNYITIRQIECCRLLSRPEVMSIQFLLERPSTDQALRVVTVRVACTKQGRPARAAVRTLAPRLVERRLRIRRSRECFASPVRSRGTCGGPGRYRSQHSVDRHWSRGRRNTRKCRAAALARNCGCS